MGGNTGRFADYAHYQAQLAHAAGLPSLVQSGSAAQSLAAAAVAGHNLSGGNQGHPVLSQAVTAAQLASAAGMHMSSPATQHHMGHTHTPVHHHTGRQKNKRPKINKDGVPAPKRATTAYINFTQWYREEIKKQGRTVPRIGDFGKECAAKWNVMPENDKAPFVETANKDRDRYKKEMAIYKPARDVNKPKRPGTAFMIFMGDFRKEMAGREPEGGVAALAKLGGERWRNMTDEDKRPYVEKQSWSMRSWKILESHGIRKSGFQAWDVLEIDVMPWKFNENHGKLKQNVPVQSVEGPLAKQVRMTNAGEDDDSLSREGIPSGLAQPSSTESDSPHTPTTPNSNDNAISQNQLQQQIQQMVAASQSQQLQNVAPPPAHSSSAALDFSTQHGATMQNYQVHTGSSLQSHMTNSAASTAINYSQALSQQTQPGTQQQQQQQPQQAQQQQQQATATTAAATGCATTTR
ncbi:High mobility group protein B3 [Nymphon striatum]|nr:High mobility group protein B3 [Nymphon striatum]